MAKEGKYNKKYCFHIIIQCINLMIFQGILAVELKKNMAETKSAAGELGQMRAEIHRMTVSFLFKNVCFFLKRH